MVANCDFENLRLNLPALRQVVGWSRKDLADELGIHKQTLKNIEHGDVQMSVAQYYAFRYVFQHLYEFSNVEKKAIYVLVASDDKEEVKELRDLISSLYPYKYRVYNTNACRVKILKTLVEYFTRKEKEIA